MDPVHFGTMNCASPSRRVGWRPDKERRYFAPPGHRLVIAFWYRARRTPLKPLPDRDFLEVI